MHFSDIEISDLFKAWIAISLAFALVWRDVGVNFGYIYLVSALTVGMAFILHELAHKFVAQRFGCWAEFRSFNMGLLLAILSALWGIVFAAPGAVMIAGVVTQEENGKIAVAGPITNIILATCFFLLSQILLSGQKWILAELFLSFGYSINAWLAFFNLIPFGPLDGVKIMNWSKLVWLILCIISGAMSFLIR